MRLEDFAEATALDEMIAAGFLEWRGGYLRATASGLLRLNAVLARLLP